MTFDEVMHEVESLEPRKQIAARMTFALNILRPIPNLFSAIQADDCLLRAIVMAVVRLQDASAKYNYWKHCFEVDNSPNRG